MTLMSFLSGACGALCGLMLGLVIAEFSRQRQWNALAGGGGIGTAVLVSMEGTCDEISDVLEEVESLTRWWPCVYLDVDVLEPGDARGVGDDFSPPLTVKRNGSRHRWSGIGLLGVPTPFQNLTFSVHTFCQRMKSANG